MIIKNKTRASKQKIKSNNITVTEDSINNYMTNGIKINEDDIIRTSYFSLFFSFRLHFHFNFLT